MLNSLPENCRFFPAGILKQVTKGKKEMKSHIDGKLQQQLFDYP